MGLPSVTPVEVPTQVVPVAPAVDAPAEGAVAPAAKKARQYDLDTSAATCSHYHTSNLHSILQHFPHRRARRWQYQEPTTTSSPTEPEAKKQKQQDDDEDKDMDLFHPLEPTDPPLLPLADQQLLLSWISRQAALEAALTAKPLRHQRLLTQNKVMIRHVRLDKRSLLFLNHLLIHLKPRLAVHLLRLLNSTRTLLKAHGRVHSQLGDSQDFMFWNTMGKHNLVLWLDYTEEATSYHTLDMSMWGAVRYHVVHSLMMIATWCSPLPLITSTLHRPTGQGYRFSRCTGFFTEFWHDPQALDVAHWLCDSFADVIAPVSFVMLSYMEEWALNATRKNRARKEATLKELKVYARLFIEAKSAEIKSWFDNDVFDLVDIRKFKPKNFVTGRWVLTVNGTGTASSRNAKRDGCCGDFKTDKKMHNKQIALRQHDQDFVFSAKMQLPMVGLSDTLTSRLCSFRGKRIRQIAMWSVSYPQRQENHGTWPYTTAVRRATKVVE